MGFQHQIHTKCAPGRLALASVEGSRGCVGRLVPAPAAAAEGKIKQRGCEVRCTAEGIETGLLGVGGRAAAAQEEGFMVPERFKVVALMACVMSLCNADRVVMSVAVVPLAAKYGWSNAFLGVVQVKKTTTSNFSAHEFNLFISVVFNTSIYFLCDSFFFFFFFHW